MARQSTPLDYDATVVSIARAWECHMVTMTMSTMRPGHCSVVGSSHRRMDLKNGGDELCFTLLGWETGSSRVDV
jgi:hypothetical protein